MRRPGRSNFQPPPPAYVTLRAAATKPAEPIERRSHDVLRADRLSGWLSMRLVGVDPIYVGTGDWDLYETQKTELVLRTCTRRISVDGEELHVPVIPGASLKGAFRSLCEAIAGGCDLERPCPQPCVICGLFGKADQDGAFAGRIGFSEATPSDPGDAYDAVGVARLPAGHQPGKRGGRRIYAPTLQGARADTPYQVVPQGVPFDFRLHLTNVKQTELGLVLLAMGCDGSFLPRIGGGKHGGLGRIRIQATGGRIRRGYNQPRASVLDERTARELVSKALEAYEPPADGKPALATLRKHLAAPGGAR